MFIKISGLSDGIHNFNINGHVEEYELKKPFYGNYVLNVELTKSRNQFILKIDFQSQAEFECDRCASVFNTELKTKFNLVYILSVESKESDDPNVVYLPFDADTINFKRDIFEFINLSVPMKKLCKDECKGLCACCGTDLNYEECKCSVEKIDERWKPLLDIKNKIKI